MERFLGPLEICQEHSQHEGYANSAASTYGEGLKISLHMNRATMGLTLYALARKDMLKVR